MLIGVAIISEVFLFFSWKSNKAGSGCCYLHHYIKYKRASYWKRAHKLPKLPDIVPLSLIAIDADSFPDHLSSRAWGCYTSDRAVISPNTARSFLLSWGNRRWKPKGPRSTQFLTAFLDAIQPIKWPDISPRLHLELCGSLPLSSFTTNCSSIKYAAQNTLANFGSQALHYIKRGCSGRKEVLQLSIRKLDPFLFPQHCQILAFHPPLHAPAPSVKQRC